VDTQKKVAVFGLGSMGYGMAMSLLKAGHQVWGVDINPAQVERFQSDGGQHTAFVDIAGELDGVVAVVLNAGQLESVLFGESGIVSKLKKGSVVLACPTIPPDFAKQMAKRCEEFGIHYLDTPISGGSKKAAAGQLTLMASGTPASFEAATPFVDAISETVFRLGDIAGAGSAMKSVNQLLAGVHIAVMAEALTFGMTQGVEPAKFLEVISKCAGTSWMLENRAPHIVDGDYTPHSSVNIWPKDLGIVLEIANKEGFDAPITKAALDQFKAASEAGLGLEDDAAVAKIYARKAGLTLPGEA
jgi:putative dehydrogenase